MTKHRPELEDAASWFFWLASAVVVPVMLGCVAYVVALLLPEGTRFPGSTAMGVIGLYSYLLAPVLGVVLAPLGAAFVGIAWRLNRHRSGRLTTLRVYFVALVLFCIYIGWWYLSGQEAVAP